jgi:hypothetical protein
MKNDPHLLLGEDPAVIQGRTISVLCGKEIVNAQPTPVWDEVIMGRPLDLEGTRICAKCKKTYAALPPPPDKETLERWWNRVMEIAPWAWKSDPYLVGMDEQTFNWLRELDSAPERVPLIRVYAILPGGSDA